jgi:hypothetical protein
MSRPPNLSLVELELLDAMVGYAGLVDNGEMTQDLADDILKSYVMAAESKRDRLAEFVLDVEAHIKNKRDRAKDLKLEADSLSIGLERLCERTMDLMVSVGVENLDGKVYKIRRRKNPGKVIVLDESEIPFNLFRAVTPPPPPPPEVDKKAIADLWKSGEQVPGTDFVVTHRLEIKP